MIITYPFMESIVLLPFYIPYTGLHSGEYHYSFDIDAAFFTAMPNAIVQSGQVAGKLVFEKQTDSMTIDITVKGSVDVECDRCLENYPQPIDNRLKLIVKFADDAHEEDEIVYITRLETRLFVAPYFLEAILLNLPIRRIHPNDGCDPRILALITGSTDSAPIRPEDDPDTVPNADNPFAKALKAIQLPTDEQDAGSN